MKTISKPLEAVHGSVRILQAIGTVGPAANAAGELSINGKPCFVRLTSTGYQLYGFDAKRGETHYDIPLDLTSCDCPDATYRSRPGGCKHVKAMRALKAAGKLVCKPATSSTACKACAGSGFKHFTTETATGLSACLACNGGSF